MTLKEIKKKNRKENAATRLEGHERHVKQLMTKQL